jgi:hypothetical protein
MNIKKGEAKYYLGNEGLPVAGATFEWTAEMLEELDRCRKSILQFSKHFTIVNLDEGKIKIDLRAYQKRILKALAKNRLVAVLSSRQSGKTTLITIYALWLLCFKKDQRILIIANKEKTALNIFQRVRLAYEKLPNYLKPGVANYGKTGMAVGNGSSIGISTTSSDAARGESCNCLIIDEAAFIPEHMMEDFWRSVYPVISSSKTGKIFMVSTANGTGNKFYNIYSEAIAGRSPWHAERVDWWDIPDRDEQWKQNTIKELGSKEAFDQEFGNVFIENGQTALDGPLLEEYKKNARDPIMTSEDGKYKIWEGYKEGHIYTIGVDVSEGIGLANSVAQVLDITDLTSIEQVAVLADNTMDPYHFAVRLNEIAQQWGTPPLLIECNGPGGQLIGAMQNVHKYEHLVSYTPSMGKLNEKINNRIGIFSHTNSKFTGVSNMRYWMNTMRSLKIWDISTINEFETYVRHPNGTWKKRSGENIWDDRVESLMWALFILETTIAQKYYEVAQLDAQGKPKRLINPIYYVPPTAKQIPGMYNSHQQFDDAPPAFFNVGGEHMDEMFTLSMDGWRPL